MQETSSSEKVKRSILSKDMGPGNIQATHSLDEERVRSSAETPRSYIVDTSSEVQRNQTDLNIVLEQSFLPARAEQQPKQQSTPPRKIVT